MGAALAIAFHCLGHHVFATARNPSKLAPLAEQGIETVQLDITSSSSITAAVGSNLLETNLWGHLAVTQPFLPLLLRSTATSPSPAYQGPRAMIVNHTSVGSLAALPFQGIYNASKAALAMLSETMRLELEGCFAGLRVIDLKTVGVKTNIIENNNINSASSPGGEHTDDVLPAETIYAPAREIVTRAMSQVDLKEGMKVTAEEWAAEVVPLLLGKNPPGAIWKGESASMARLAVSLPRWGNHGGGLFEGFLKKMTGLSEVESVMKESRGA
ncbi:short-chain dehydrogenase [Rhypophila decipiens]|uniref:Short-chain dehydrogenase n=1 Tax=Rhypophila decipiens TaxID=261697 RepID=A0AAN6XUH8_9PEZI|nr:short-chain dehydrogenase [Rhypophila decipiens]